MSCKWNKLPSPQSSSSGRCFQIYFWNFHPYFLGKIISIFDVCIFFQRGWGSVQPPTTSHLLRYWWTSFSPRGPRGLCLGFLLRSVVWFWSRPLPRSRQQCKASLVVWWHGPLRNDFPTAGWRGSPGGGDGGERLGLESWRVGTNIGTDVRSKI